MLLLHHHKAEKFRLNHHKSGTFSRKKGELFSVKHNVMQNEISTGWEGQGKCHGEAGVPTGL